MFIEGKIKSYNAERGFGFIEIEGQDQAHAKVEDIFFHITELPNKAVAPKIGERLKFRTIVQNNKTRAVNIVRLDLKNTSESEQKSIQQYGNKANLQQKLLKTGRNKQAKKSSFDLLSFMVGIGILVIFLSVLIPMLKDVYHRQMLKYQSPKYDAEMTNTQHVVSATPKQQSSSEFRCDGRTHCSQMRSYEEAVYFINHCPGTKMDGNGDGIPCERQFNR